MNSQLRQDLVSGDWIVVAPVRARRPHPLIKKPEKRKVAPIAGCPFEDPQKSGHEKPLLIYASNVPRPASSTKSNWKLQIVQNKYPAFTHRNLCAVIGKDGPYAVTDTVGHHDLIITRDHHRNFAALSKNEARQVLEAFRDRYLMLLNDQCVAFVSIFHNWGPTAGASIYHPHYQMVAAPIVPPDVTHSLHGSKEYFKKYRRCVHCVMIDWEKKTRKRLIAENNSAIAFAPFVSKNPFEVRIFPKSHLPYFENTLDHDLDAAADLLQTVLQKIKKNLKDPDYNFFIHTAPIQSKNSYTMYHWHIEVLPKITIRAGFELGTGMDINVVDPNQAAHLLRK